MVSEQIPDSFRMRLHALTAAYNENRVVKYRQRSLRLTRKINVTRSVDESYIRLGKRQHSLL